MLAAVTVASLGCRSPFPAIAPPTPPALPFATDTVRVEQRYLQTAHWYLYSRTGPWSIHALVLDGNPCVAVRAVKGFTTPAGRMKTSEALQQIDDTVPVIGGVNADFFAPDGTPVNAHVSGGRALTPFMGRPVLGVEHVRRFRIVTPRAGASADSVGLREVVGGRLVLVRDSVVLADVDTVGGPGFATTRHPRTAAGVARDGRRLMLVTVDGRQTPFSDGMTLRELADLMRALGSRDAINLDGGGSTTMVLANQQGVLRVVNKPSDAAGERPVGNSLALVSVPGCE